MDIEKCKKEGRARILAISPNEIITLLRGWCGFDYARLPLLMDLPADAVVLECFYCAERLAFGIMIYHDSFESTQAGSHLPWFVPEIKTVKMPFAEVGT